MGARRRKRDRIVSVNYKTEGYQILSFLSNAQLNGFRSVIGDRLDAAIQSQKVPAELRFSGEPSEKRLERIAQLDNKIAESLLLSIYQTAHLDERIGFLDGDPALREIAENLLGAEIKTFTIRVRANVPSLPGKRQDWHSDVSVLDDGEFAKVKIACWIPLANVGIHNGTLEIVPGRRAKPMAHHGDPNHHTIREEDLAAQEKKILDCSLGSAVFLDSFVPHRAIPNLSDSVRWSVVIWMTT